jgi:hydroxymethylpyrimidine/phosphomethylpyrimidine kinase
MKGRILCIGEHIANGGLGLHGDIITVTALGGHALSVPTFLSTSIAPTHRQCLTIDPAFISKQINSCIESPGVDAIKIGAINNSVVLDTIGAILSKQAAEMSVVVNPVLTTEAGEYLLPVEAIESYKKNILKHTTTLVVNIRDAELLTGCDIIDVPTMCHAAKQLHGIGCGSVLLTGGLLSGDDLHDVLVTANGEEVLTVKKNNIHRAESYRFGGGWALATAIATSLAQGFDLKNSINRARQFVDKAIGTSFNSDENYQNLNLAHTIHPFVHDDSSHVYTVIPGSRFRSL